MRLRSPRYVLALLLAMAALPGQEKPPEKCSVSGRVSNAATGEPLRKAQVVLHPLNAGRPNLLPYGAITDTSGAFSLSDVDPGQYALTAEHTGFVNGSYGAQQPGHGGTPLTLTPGQVLKDADIRLTPQGIVSGRIVDEDGDPVANAMVQLLRYSYVQGKRQLMAIGARPTNDLGEYRLYEVPPGRYLVTATWRGALWRGQYRNIPGGPDGAYAPTYYPGTTDPATAVPIQVAAGSQMQGINLTLTKTPVVTISGKVVYAGGDPSARNTMVLLSPRGDAWVASPNSTSIQDPQGRFELHSVIPGAYILMAESWADGQRYTARQPVNVGNANLDGISLTLLPGVRLAGVVRLDGAGQTDLSKVRIFLLPTETNLSTMGTPSAPAKTDGTFVLSNVGPDSYTVGVAGAPDNCYLKSIRMGPQEIGDDTVDLGRGDSGPLEVLLSPAGGQVYADVVNAKQQAGAGAEVVLIPDPPRRGRTDLYQSATADQRGNVILRGIAPGPYRLYAWESVEDGAWLDPDFLRNYENQGQAVTIGENSREGVQLNLISRP